MTQANEKYTGVFIFNKLVSKDIDDKRNGNAYKEVEEIIRIEGAVPAIISKEEFESAQNIILSRKRVRAANNVVETYLLSGKIFCGECGELMSETESLLEETKRCRSHTDVLQGRVSIFTKIKISERIT